MLNIKTIALLLLFSFCFSVLAPATQVYAAPANTAGNSDQGIITTLTGLLLGYLLNNVLHLNINLPNSPEKTPSASAGGGKDVLGFYAEWWGTDDSSYQDLVKHSSDIGTIVPFWGTLNGDGSLSDRGGNDHPAVVKYAKANNVTTLLMVNNSKQGNESEGIHAVLSSPALRTKAINNMEAYIKKYGLNGINIDFEMVPAGDRDALTAFMSELSSRLKPQGYIVSIDVFPKHNEENDVAAAYDYAKLASYADKIILMTYDYHGSWSAPGAIADIQSVEKDLKYALNFIPKNKIYLGLAGYGYDWSSKGVESLENSAIQNLITRFGVSTQWDDTAKAPHFQYTGNDGITHQVWYENKDSVKYKVDLMNKYDIRGVALWKLGEEDQAVWQVLKH